ncbi:MAG: three-Cys-motif partner protein TcmP [Symploca sp. SIO1B1]|nr:three-Cys-motif partner protein TcmP [Symploca sp. SIO1B1]
MSKAQAKWSADGSYIPAIDIHTEAKHQILEEYIENLIITLVKKSQYGERTFTFIDGFCGGGIYKKDNNYWAGSPIRIIKAVRSGYLKSKRKLSLNVKFIFIDSKKAHLACLKNYSMEKFGLGELIDEHPHEFNSEFGKLVEQCEFISGDFEMKVRYCIYTVNQRKGHSFFLLDPFGWSYISMSSIRAINALSGSEILYTYMIKDLKRFVIGKHGKDALTFNKLLEADGYYESVDLKKLNEVDEQRYLRNESLRLFRDKGQVKYAHTFSLIPQGHIVVSYYLMHFSQNLTALQVMREALWKYNGLYHLFEFDVYGFGIKTVDEYKKKSGKLDFSIEGTFNNFEDCIDILDKNLGSMIRGNYEGNSFRKICRDTIQRNPASRKHYKYYINRLLKDKEVEILRNGKIVKGHNIDIQNKDIIRATGNKQLYLF